MSRHKLAALPLLIGLASCSSPSPEYLGSSLGLVEINGRQFNVYARDDRAQLIRMNREWGADAESVVQDAIRAAEQATGCRVKEGSAEGDVAIIEVDLIC